MESKCFSPTTRITRSQPGRNCARRPPCLSSFWGQRLERKGLAQNSIDIIVNVRYFVFAFHYICQKVVLVLVLSLGMSFVFPFCVYIAWNAISQGIGVEWILSKICRKFGRQSTPLQSHCNALQIIKDWTFLLTSFYLRPTSSACQPQKPSRDIWNSSAVITVPLLKRHLGM